MKPFDVYTIFDIDIKKASGAKLWDTKDQEYLDLYGGHAVISVGHSHPRYVKAISGQLQNIGFYSNSVKISQQDELAAKLGELSGYADYALFLCNSGAEANENAFKLASFHNGRRKIIAFSAAFHGRTSLAVSATDNPAINAPVNKTEHVVFLPFNDVERLKKEIDADTCAVIVEGIQGVAGIHSPSTEFLKTLEQLCHEQGALLILDEVQSGYGRSGKFFAHQHAGIRPDIITIAKGMGNGFPVGGVLISPKIAAKKEMLGTTFGGNYLACAAAIAVLDIMKDENLMHNAATVGSYLVEQLQKTGGIREIRGTGLMLGIELNTPCADVRRDLLFNHHIFTGSAANKNTIRILPPLSISQEELHRFATALISTLAS